VGASSIGARESLVDLFGGLDNLTAATQAYSQGFLTQAEQLAPVISSVQSEMARLGLAGVTTKDQFKAVVQSLNLSTDAGQQLYAALLGVAPAFAKVIDAATEMTQKSNDLQIRLMTAQGNASGALALRRQMELDATEASLRPLLQQVYAAEDASKALSEVTSKFGAFSDQLKAYRDSLKLDTAFGVTSYRTAQVEFMKMAGLAGAGDEAGLAGLQGASSSFLDQSRSRSSTYQQYQRDVAMVLAAVEQGIGAADARSGKTGIVQLNATAAQIGGTLQQVVVTVADGNADLARRVDKLEETISAGLIAIAQNTSKSARLQERWDRGTGMAIVADETLPVDQI
jgi:hypothetical protein